MRVLRILGLLSFFAFPYMVQAQGLPSDPDRFSLRQTYTGAPHFFREAEFAERHLPDHWPFIASEGLVSCVTVDGISLAFFEIEGAEEPFMLGENMFMTFVGTMVTGWNAYVRKDYDPEKLIVDLEKTYGAALNRCGPPYAQ